MPALAVLTPLFAVLVAPRSASMAARAHPSALLRAPAVCMTEAGRSDEPVAVDAEVIDGTALTMAEAEEIGNLVADDEYLGLGMELAEVVRLTLKEGLKENLREFLGKDDYKVRERTRVEH